MKAIMYHYIRRYDPKLPFFRYLNFENFKKQLDFFEDRYGFVSLQDWKNYILINKNSEPPRGVILTFDDSVSCHYDFVFNELVKRGLWGIFYVPTQPYSDQKMLDVHRIHLLIGSNDSKKLISLLNNLVSEDMIPDKKREEFDENTYLNQKNSQNILLFKKTLNYFISYEYREKVLDELAKLLNLESFVTSFYISEKNIVKMNDSGMIIGSHTVSHPVMSKLDFGTQKLEISKSFNFLESICNIDHRTYSHPYGHAHTYNENTVKILNNYNVAYSFSVKSEDFRYKLKPEDIQKLPRYDCNEFEYGKTS